MTLGGLALILGLIWLPLGRVTAPLAWPFVLFTIRAVEVFGRFRRGVLALGDLSLLWVILFYALLLGLTLAGSRFRERLTGLKPVPVLAFLGIATVVTWRAALCAPDERLHLTMLDVGSGDALLIRTPNGRNLLVDGGPSTSLLSDGLGRRLPPFRRQLDWLVVAYPQGENVASLPRLLDRFPPDRVIWAGPDSASRSVDYLRADLTEREIPVTSAEPGHCLDLDAGANLCFLTVGKRGAILLLAWDHFRAALPVGAAADDYHALNMGSDVGPVNVLMLAEGGFAPLLHPLWLDNLNPQLVLLSVAPDDPSGLPNRETLDMLGGYSLLRTDRHGWVHISTDGDQMWVEIEKR
jgi:competence protein ComEC